MAIYAARRVEFEARRFIDFDLTGQEKLAAWCGGKLLGDQLPLKDRRIVMESRHGFLQAVYGDYIIQTAIHEFSPMSPLAFEKQYEKVK